MHEKLKKLRLLKGYSQRGIAKKMAMSQQAYSKIENSRTRLHQELIVKILDAMGCTYQDLERLDKF